MGSPASKIFPSLFLGSGEGLKDPGFWEKHRFTHVVSMGNLAPDREFVVGNELEVLQINKPDLPSVDLAVNFQEAAQFIHKGRSQGGIVFVHCAAGISRSSTIVLAYLMPWLNADYETALAFLVNKRRGVSPNKGFIAQLEEFGGSEDYLLLQKVLRDGEQYPACKDLLAADKKIVDGCTSADYGIDTKDDSKSALTVKTSDILEKIEDSGEFKHLVHGTYWKKWAHIKKNGLKKMTRHHIHLAPTEKEAELDPLFFSVICGMKKTAQLFIYIDVRWAMKDGIEFYRASNDLIVTEGDKGTIPPKYFKRVVSRDGKPVELTTQVKKKTRKSQKNGAGEHKEEANIVKEVNLILSNGGFQRFVVAEALTDTKIEFSGFITGKKISQKYNRCLKKIRKQFGGVEFIDGVEKQ